MSRGSRLDKFMFDSVLFAEYIERMFPVVFHFLRKGKFRAVVRLNDLRGIAEERDRPFNEVNRAVGVLLTVRVNKPFARGFVDYPVLIESFVIDNRIGDTFFRHILNVHLHFHSDLFGRIVRFRFIRRISFFRIVKAVSFQIPVKRNRITAVCVIQTKFTI